MDERVNIQNVPDIKKPTEKGYVESRRDFAQAMSNDKDRRTKLAREARGAKPIALNCGYCEQRMRSGTSRKKYCSDRCRKKAHLEERTTCYLCSELYSDDTDLTAVIIFKQDIEFGRNVCRDCFQTVTNDRKGTYKNMLLRHFIDLFKLNEGVLTNLIGEDDMPDLGYMKYGDAFDHMERQRLGCRRFLSVLQNKRINDIVNIRAPYRLPNPNL